jgi:hydroxymethylpyrimidine pyrophosphatase-like HAD family hydrolase
VQNGADLIKMPEKHHVKSFYLDKSVVFAVEKLFEDKKEDFLVYAGYEQGDFCYYRPKQYSEKMVSYLEQMQRRAAEPWVALEHFSSLPQEQFPMIKAMGLEREFIGIEAELLKTHSLNCVVIKDPRREGYSYLLITDYRASKKEAISHFFSLYNLKRPLIVAGDDHNDKESLEYADVRIVMENAPSSLKMLADIIAAPSHHHGIIQGLAQALQLCEQEGFEQRWA